MEGTRKIIKKFQITSFSIKDTISKTLKLLLKRVIRWECKSTYALDIPAKYLTQWHSTQFRLRLLQKFRLFSECIFWGSYFLTLTKPDRWNFVREKTVPDKTDGLVQEEKNFLSNLSKFPELFTDVHSRRSSKG